MSILFSYTFNNFVFRSYGKLHKNTYTSVGIEIQPATCHMSHLAADFANIHVVYLRNFSPPFAPDLKRESRLKLKLKPSLNLKLSRYLVSCSIRQHVVVSVVGERKLTSKV